MKIGPFLKRNNFRLLEPNSYGNDLCNVVIDADQITVANNYGTQNFGPNDFYWLVGFLTYHGFLNQNYIK